MMLCLLDEKTDFLPGYSQDLIEKQSMVSRVHVFAYDRTLVCMLKSDQSEKCSVSECLT